MEPITASEGWFVSHLFWRVDRRAWAELTAEERSRAGESFAAAIADARGREQHQIYCYSVWGLSADLAVLAVCPDLQQLNDLEYELATALPAGVLVPALSFVSMSESSEYISQEDDYVQTLTRQGLEPDSEEFNSKLEAFRERMRSYVAERLYPKLPGHRVMCFYPMNKLRGEQNNWYMLDFDDRKRFMASHGITGRQYSPQIKQLVTGSVGLDDWEWGVTLFADDPYYLKKIVYEMRYDEASARFGEFGPFRVGINLEPEDLLRRLRLG